MGFSPRPTNAKQRCQVWHLPSCHHCLQFFRWWLKNLNGPGGGLLGCVVSFKLKFISSVTCFRSSSMIVEGTSKRMKKSDYWERICSNKRRPTRIQKRNRCVSRYQIFVFRLLKKFKTPNLWKFEKDSPTKPKPLTPVRSFSPTSHQCRCLGVVAPHRKFVALHKQERSSGTTGHLKDCHFGMSRFGTPE